MRRKEREISAIEEKLQVIRECPVCRIAFAGEMPYIVPVNFGWKEEKGGLVLYFHGAMAGRKYELVQESMKKGEILGCGFEMDHETNIVVGKDACSYSYLYESIVGTGGVELVEDIEEKKQGLCLIMQHMTGKEFSFQEEMVENVAVFRLTVQEYTGKRHK